MNFFPLRVGRMGVVSCLALIVVNGPDREPPHVWSMLRYILPFPIAEIRLLQDRIAEWPVENGNDRERHLRRLDEIYREAVRIAEGDIRGALFLAAGATIPYRWLSLRIPIVGAVVHVPLTFETTEEFEARYRRLPSRLFPDTPPEGDRDKPPHVYGSAWLSCVIGNEGLVRLAGWLVEIGETLFAVVGSNDIRDIRANSVGIDFADTLRIDGDAMPSHVLPPVSGGNEQKRERP
ncbi:MAG: hypothetical protein QHI48_12365 [Bacteroidota bacterium]|nr:hypothetical protein [Bacteroidota bacterium]